MAVPVLRAQVVIDESRMGAVLRDGSTVVMLPIANASPQPVKASLALAWVDHKEIESGAVLREVVLQPGTTTLETPLRLQDPSIWTRLRYSLTPDRAGARQFARLAGTVGLTRIAGHVFELNIGFAGTAKRGRPMVVHAEAVHPLTRLPVDVEWQGALVLNDTKVAPTRVARLAAGAADFTFAFRPPRPRPRMTTR
jgi:hypothetical protein